MPAEKLNELRSETNGKQDIPEKKKRGCLIGCLGTIFFIILLFFIIPVFISYFCIPESYGDRDKVIEDIYRYHKNYGNWPQSLKQLKAKLPDYQFKYNYFYFHNNEMFVVRYRGSGLACDDWEGDYYRSDTKEWKSIRDNHEEYDNLESSFNKLYLN